MIRLAAALLMLSLASPALALPVSYDFTVPGVYGGPATGSLTYDAETGAVVLLSFIAPVLDLLPALDWLADPALWPESRDAFPVYSLQVVAFGLGSLEAIELHTTVGYVLFFDSTCPVETPRPDCPFGAATLDQGQDYFSVNVVPEPSAVATLLLAATGLLATGSCRRRPLRR